MNLTDLIPKGVDLHAVMHRKEPFPSQAQVKAKRERLEHIFAAFRKCISECGSPSRNSIAEEIAITCTNILVIDEAIEYLSAQKQRQEWSKPIAVSDDDMTGLGGSTLNDLRNMCCKAGIDFATSKSYAVQIDEALEAVPRQKAIAGAVMFIMLKLAEDLDEIRAKQVQ